MKTFSTALDAHYASGGTTMCRLWKCTRRDAQVFGFTDHDVAVLYDSVTYAPKSGFTASALKSASDFTVDNLELQGLLESDAIAPEDIEAGLWDGATIELLEVNWADLTAGDNPLRVGSLGEVQHVGVTYVAELRGLMHKLQNNVGRIVTPSCDAKLGDPHRCKVDLEALRVSGVVTAVADLRKFTAAALAGADGYFSFGEITWTSGANVDMRMEIHTHAAGGVLQLQLEMPNPILPGDTFTIVPGCDRSKAVCKTKFNNVVNFQGFSLLPGTDKILLVGGQ